MMNILETIKNTKVEWKSLDEIATLYGGLTSKTKDDFENGNAKFVNYKNIFANLAVDFSQLESVKIGKN